MSVDARAIRRGFLAIGKQVGEMVEKEKFSSKEATIPLWTYQNVRDASTKTMYREEVGGLLGGLIRWTAK